MLARIKGLGCMVKANCSHAGPGTAGRVPSEGVFLRDPRQYLFEFRKKNTENSEWLGRQVRPRSEPGTSRLSVLGAELFSHWQRGTYKRRKPDPHNPRYDAKLTRVLSRTINILFKYAFEMTLLACNFVDWVQVIENFGH